MTDDSSLRVENRMPQSFFRRTVDAWLEDASPRFDRRPYVIQRRQRYILLGFAGIPESLHLRLSSSSACEIRVLQSGSLWDLLGDFDLFERRTAEGLHFCELCLERKLYASRKELWVTHSLEPLLEWANRELKSGRALYLYQVRDGGATWARIRPATGTAGAEDPKTASFVYPFG